jgi:creatinine deaminase
MDLEPVVHNIAKDAVSAPFSGPKDAETFFPQHFGTNGFSDGVTRTVRDATLSEFGDLSRSAIAANRRLARRTEVSEELHHESLHGGSARGGGSGPRGRRHSDRLGPCASRQNHRPRSNRRVQRGSAVLHGEMDALENAGRRTAAVYADSVIYTTLSPCAMCSGAILLFRIPRVIVADIVTFMGEEDLLRSCGVIVKVLQEPRCIELMRTFIRDNPSLWNEDIGT